MTIALYVPRVSAVHRVPAGGKLLALATLGVLLLVVPTLPVTAAALTGVLIAGLVLARLPVSVFTGQVKVLRWWLAALFVVDWVVVDLATGVLAVIRLLALVLAATVVTATCRVTELVAVVERICAPLRLVGVRPARIGLVLAMTLRFIPVVAERAHRIREARAARGGTVRGVRALAVTSVPLLVQVLQLAHTLSEALDARGADT